MTYGRTISVWSPTNVPPDASFFGFDAAAIGPPNVHFRTDRRQEIRYGCGLSPRSRRCPQTPNAAERKRLSAAEELRRQSTRTTCATDCFPYARIRISLKMGLRLLITGRDLIRAPVAERPVVLPPEQRWERWSC
jgi:hypothetical protein